MSSNKAMTGKKRSTVLFSISLVAAVGGLGPVAEVNAQQPFASPPPPAKSANKAVLCGWETTRYDQPSADGKGMRYGKFERVANQDGRNDRPRDAVNRDCDSAIKRIAETLGTTVDWYRQRKETTWADRGANSDPVAVYFGIFDLLSCMADGRVYEVNYDGKTVKIKDSNNGWVGAERIMPASQNKCS